VVEDVVGIVLAFHARQPVVDVVSVRLADPVRLLVGAEEVDVDAVAEAVEGGEEAPRPGDSTPDAWLNASDRLFQILLLC
jgi:hypothetical protein